VDAAIRELLEGPNFGHLATVMDDGGPHSAVVWATVLDDERLGFVTDPRSVKGRNIARDPRVALSIVDHDNPYRTAQLRGRVVGTRTGDEAQAALNAMAHRHTGRDYPYRGGVLYEVEIEHANFTDLPVRRVPSAAR
jgi:PPOX class probable F420-dependent enzyme